MDKGGHYKVKHLGDLPGFFCLASFEETPNNLSRSQTAAPRPCRPLKIIERVVRGFGIITIVFVYRTLLMMSTKQVIAGGLRSYLFLIARIIDIDPKIAPRQNIK